MSRIAVGRELLQITVSNEVAQTIRLRAAMDAVTPGKVVEQAIIATNVRMGVVEELTSGKKVSQKASPRTSEAAPKLKAGAVPGEHQGKPWDHVRLDKVMEAEGLSGQKMAEKLVSRNGGTPNKNQVLNWRNGKEAIPPAYWSQLEKLFGVK